MNILLASDEKTHLTDAIEQWLAEHEHHVTKAGHLIAEQQKWHWAEIGKEAAQQVASGAYEGAIICCWSGTGVAIAANRIPGVRAALCWDAETARLARKWDNANVLALSLRYTSETVAKEILEAWFATTFNEEGLGQAKLLDDL